MSYRLILDDLRTAQQCTVSNGKFNYVPLLQLTETKPEDWVIVRNYDQFVQVIKERGIPDFISFDHDLDRSAMREYFFAIENGKPFNYNNVKEKTGLDCAKFLIDKCKESVRILPEITLHTANTLGWENINAELEAYRKFQAFHTSQQ